MVSVSACPTVNKVMANFSAHPDASSPCPVTRLKIRPWGRRILSPRRCHHFVTGLCFFPQWRCLETGVQESSTQRMGQPPCCKWEDKDLVLAVQEAPSGKEAANFPPPRPHLFVNGAIGRLHWWFSAALSQSRSAAQRRRSPHHRAL